MSMRVKTGIYGLDPLLGGGFLPNTVNVVLGTTGVGKTLFSLHYAFEGLKNGENCLYISFDMNENEILKTARSMGWDVDKYVNEGSLKVRKFVVEDITFLNNELLSFIFNNVSGRTRIVIDSFTPLVSTHDYSVRKDVNWFFERLREVGTTVITLEEPLSGNIDHPHILMPVFLGDSLIHMKKLGYGDVLDKIIRILKHRNSWHAEGVFPYKILKGLGIVVDSKNYVERLERKVELRNVLSDEEIERLPEELLERIRLALEDHVYNEREVVSLVKWVIECYLSSNRS